MKEEKIKRVILEFETYTLELNGKEAEKWKQVADGMATLSFVHGMRPDFRWKKISLPVEIGLIKNPTKRA